MKVEVISNEKNNLEFFIEGERHTLANLLKERLAKMNGVEFCAYRLDHPLDKKARFIVKTSDKNPKKLVEEAIDKVQAEIKEFEKAFEKAK